MTGTETLKIVFVCTGNICRSAMADVMARDALEREGLLNQVRVESCGLGGWHVGQGADHRAVETLREHGLDGTEHRAKQYGPQFADANLFIVMDDGHRRALRNDGVPSHKIRFLRSFDPAGGRHEPLQDPYYGTKEDFTDVYHSIESALPGLLSWVTRELEDRSDR
ncbi:MULTISPECIES: low molecular weight protein-tyrosine-phosphatase [Corynebacterium]|uniref:low molecular weight protein-tyrosine-phosphatase n=1 Tax=Corynebacterium TaxID=1716 RepID=UPI00264D5701|nr:MULTISPECIES: low molecular weight protein-tyrosine-phosphatase [Corynebacterium]MDN8625126.1 low molecular weight protein-tyrosine-phosphatase [Corynebacterium kroppenstedtii]